MMLDLVLAAPGPRGRTGLPAILWGPPGAGKTAAIEAAAARAGLWLVTVLLSIREPADVAGYPVPGAGGVRLEPPAWARQLVARGAGVLFLDELSCAAPAVQAAALRVLAEGVVGELVLPPGVRVIAAANPPDQAAGGWALSPPLANRMVHLPWDPWSPEEWATWLLGLAELDPRVRAGVAGAVRSGAAPLLALPESEEARGGAWPSPRSWELAARALSGAVAAGLGEGPRQALLAGAVGEGAALAAWRYLAALDLPDPEEVLAGRAQVPLDRDDRAYASLAAVIALALRDPVAHERRLRALEVAAEVSRGGHRDVAVALAGPLAPSLAALVGARAPREHQARAVRLAGELGQVARLAREAAAVGMEE